MKRQVNPDPNIGPQTHYANERVNKNYSAKNNGYVIKGKNYFSSSLIKQNLK